MMSVVLLLPRTCDCLSSIWIHPAVESFLYLDNKQPRCQCRTVFSTHISAHYAPCWSVRVIINKVRVRVKVRFRVAVRITINPTATGRDDVNATAKVRASARVRAQGRASIS